MFHNDVGPFRPLPVSHDLGYAILLYCTWYMLNNHDHAIQATPDIAIVAIM